MSRSPITCRWWSLILLAVTLTIQNIPLPSSIHHSTQHPAFYKQAPCAFQYVAPIPMHSQIPPPTHSSKFSHQLTQFLLGVRHQSSINSNWFIFHSLLSALTKLSPLLHIIIFISLTTPSIKILNNHGDITHLWRSPAVLAFISFNIYQ